MIWDKVKSAASWAWTKAEASGKWLVSVVSEPDGTGSSSRAALGLVTLTVCGALAGHMWLHRTLPDHDTLTGLAELLAAGSGGYVGNKITNRVG